MQSKKNSGGTAKRFFVGLLGGVLGGLLTMGGFYLASGSNLAPATDSTANSNSSAGTTQVSNVKVDAESDITSAVDKVQDAVVSIINLQKQSQSSEIGPWGGMFGSQQESESNQKEDDSGNMQEAGEGSGVIYKKSGDSAFVVTNNHVVDQADGLEVVMKDGTKLKAELVGTDSYSDLAVLKIAADKVDKVATFGDSDALKVGEPAIAIGSPLGSQYANSVTSGIVSSLNRQVTDEATGVNTNAIQTDAAINPGNSGGALINIAGQVIGINSSKIASTQSSSSNISVEGMGFAIPSNDVVTIIDQLEKDGKVSRPALGITMRDLSTISSQQQEQILKVPTDLKTGVVVLSVSNATPAEKAGLKQYDVITKIDGKEIETATDLQSALYKKKIGDTMEITYYRESKENTTKVELSLDSTAMKSENQSNE